MMNHFVPRSRLNHIIISEYEFIRATYRYLPLFELITVVFLLDR